MVDLGVVAMKHTEETINKIIDDAILALIGEEWGLAKEALEELAHVYKSAGSSLETFIDLCTYIENQAVEQTGNEMIRTRFGLGLRDLKQQEVAH